MEAKNNVLRMKELILRIQEVDRAYFLLDEPIMSDHEYDALVEELRELEKLTGIIFANSPTKRVGGANKAELQTVLHSKPMLSAQKTKSVDEILAYFGDHSAVVSWKLDGLTLVLRYQMASS